MKDETKSRFHGFRFTEVYLNDSGKRCERGVMIPDYREIKVIRSQQIELKNGTFFVCTEYRDELTTQYRELAEADGRADLKDPDDEDDDD